MSEQIKIAKPKYETIQKVESFVNGVNREIMYCIRIHEEKREEEKRKREKPLEYIVYLSLILTGILFVKFLDFFKEDEVLYSLGGLILIPLTAILFCFVLVSFGADIYLKWRTWKDKREITDITHPEWVHPEWETDSTRNRIAGKDIGQLLNQLAKENSLQYSWKGTQINKNGDIVTDWTPDFGGYPFGKPEELIQTIICDGILFINARYWRPMKIFPDQDNGNGKVAIINHQKRERYIDLYDSVFTLRKIPLDPDTDEFSTLETDHENEKFLPIEADEETMDYLVNRLSR